MIKAQRLAVEHQLNAAAEYSDVRYRMSVPYARAIDDYIIFNQAWGARYAAYAREQMQIRDEDQVYA
jgi:hypothetical protein